MAKYVIDSSTLTDIANAIREENTWIFDEIPTEQMSTEIRNLQNGHLDIGQNGTYNVKGMGSVDVAVPSYPEPTGSTTITENGTYNVKDFAEALVNVAGGGGLPGLDCDIGTFTPQSNLDSYDIELRKPLVMGVYVFDSYPEMVANTVVSLYAYSVDGVIDNSTNGIQSGYISLDYQKKYSSVAFACTYQNGNVFTVAKRSQYAEALKYRIGHTYHYIVIYGEA